MWKEAEHVPACFQCLFRQACLRTSLVKCISSLSQFSGRVQGTEWGHTSSGLLGVPGTGRAIWAVWSMSMPGPWVCPQGLGLGPNVDISIKLPRWSVFLKQSWMAGVSVHLGCCNKNTRGWVASTANIRVSVLGLSPRSICNSLHEFPERANILF